MSAKKPAGPHDPGRTHMNATSAELDIERIEADARANVEAGAFVEAERTVLALIERLRAAEARAARLEASASVPSVVALLDRLDVLRGEWREMIAGTRSAVAKDRLSLCAEQIDELVLAARRVVAAHADAKNPRIAALANEIWDIAKRGLKPGTGGRERLKEIASALLALDPKNALAKAESR